MNSRRNFLKRSSIAAGIGLGVPMEFNIIKKGLKPTEEETILGHGDYRYRMNKNWAQLSSVHTPLLNCHEMVMDSKGRLVMIGDHPENNILIFDKSGKLLNSWGTAYPGGHGICLSEEGEEDFLFITDSGWYLDKNGKWIKHNGRVSKTTLDGKVLFDIGHPQTIGIYEPGENFCPTEVAIGPQGDIYVADGYGQDYIIQYSSKGEYIRHWGGHNNTNPDHNLHNAHGIAVDYRNPDQPMLVCTSRSENTFKFFSLDGEYHHSLHLPNMYVCRAVLDDNNLYAGVCWSKPKDREFHWNEHTGFVTILEGDKLASNPGGTAPQYKEGKLLPSYQLDSKPIWHGHDVCVDEDKNLYICQWNANQTAPIKLERI